MAQCCPCVFRKHRELLLAPPRSSNRWRRQNYLSTNADEYPPRALCCQDSISNMSGAHGSGANADATYSRMWIILLGALGLYIEGAQIWRTSHVGFGGFSWFLPLDSAAPKCVSMVEPDNGPPTAAQRVHGALTLAFHGALTPGTCKASRRFALSLGDLPLVRGVWPYSPGSRSFRYSCEDLEQVLLNDALRTLTLENGP